MKTFKQKSLFAALAGVSALGVTGAAQAVNVNPEGLGQVLIYPYYTTRSIGAAPGAPYYTALTVVNSTGSSKAVKVRFIEGKASQEVLDFNLFLSPKDVWTAGIVSDGSGSGVGTFDNSCTVPALPADGGLVPFVNFAYAGDPVGDDSLDRTNEGYAEIIEMGTIITGSDTYVATKHVNGVPPCTPSVLYPSTVNDPSDPVNIAIGNDLTTPTGGLFGDMTIYNVLAGTDYTEDAVALDNFRNSSAYEAPGSILPDLTQVNPPISVVFSGSTITRSGFFGPGTRTVDAISALFMHDHVYNTFVLDTETSSGTDWVVNFPTKRYYFNSDGTVITLFENDLTTTGACDDISTLIYDREENSAKGSVGFSPPAPGQANQLCWEANVLTFNGSQVLGSTNNRNVTTTYSNGWLDLSFPVPTTGTSYHQLFPSGSTTIDLFGNSGSESIAYNGLPVIGFAAESYLNGNIGGVQSSYGGNYVHKTTTAIVPVIDDTAAASKSKHAKSTKAKK
jgi:hypothetical protein